MPFFIDFIKRNYIKKTALLSKKSCFRQFLIKLTGDIFHLDFLLLYLYYMYLRMWIFENTIIKKQNNLIGGYREK